MRARPLGLEDEDVAAAVATHWEIHATNVEYVPEGGGSYHWRIVATDGDSVFVSVDNLDAKPWLGEDRDATFEGLATAFATAARLREAACEFVVAPTPTASGRLLERLTSRYSIAVFPYVDGRAGKWGERMQADTVAEFARHLARLHASTPAVRDCALRRTLDIPGREQLDAALDAVDEPWTHGPFAEPARLALAERASAVREWLERYATLAQSVRRRGAPSVVTHGEPHPGNTIQTPGGLVLIDWDTVALAPRERDLWMFEDRAPEALAAYLDVAGVEIDPEAMELYRLAWTLTDLAAFASVLRAPHDIDADSEKALSAFCSYLT
jgi:aminoglycoside phosphotransferase (APT) family kinase protein